MTKTSRQKIDNVIDFVLVFLLLNLRYLTPFFSSVARRFMNVTFYDVLCSIYVLCPGGPIQGV